MLVTIIKTMKIPLSELQFWEIIDSAWEGNSSIEGFNENLERILLGCQPEEIVGFGYHLQRKLVESNKDDIWCAAYLVGGGCSDDGFYAFCLWLISKGQKCFDSVVENADTLIGFVKEDDFGRYLENELLFGIPEKIYVAKNGGSDFYEVESKLQPKIPIADKLVFTWNEERPETMKKICPRLYEKYCSESGYMTKK